MRANTLKRAFMLMLVAVIFTATAQAEFSRDFGSDDAERLARLATAELPDAGVYTKAEVVLNALEYANEHDCSIAAAVLHFPSAIDGTYLGTVPDAASRQAVELVYQGYNGGRIEKMFITCTTDLIHVLEWLLPMLAMLFTLTLMVLISMGLARLQELMGR